MSVRQLEFQVSVIRTRLAQSAVDIEQVFGDLLLSKGQSLGTDEIRVAVMHMSANTSVISEFVERMCEVQPRFVVTMTRGINTCINLFHHAEIAHSKQRIGRVDLGITLWQKVFSEMIKATYVHPGMYVSSPTVALPEAVKIVERVLDTVLYGEVPIRFEDTTCSRTVGLTPSNIGRAHVAPNNHRMAPSVISTQSTTASSVLSFSTIKDRQARGIVRESIESNNGQSALTRNGIMTIPLTDKGGKGSI